MAWWAWGDGWTWMTLEVFSNLDDVLVRVDPGALARLKHVCAVPKPSDLCLQNPLSESALGFHFHFHFI